MIKDIIDRHEKAVLMFSGGKDSLACLYLLSDFLEKITVLWVNTGNVFPENEAIVRKHAKKVPHFLEVKTDVSAFKKTYGMPTDLLPIKNTHLGISITQETDMPLVSGYDCCAANLWFPALQAAKDIGATLIIRGQRNQEYAKSPVRSGDVRDGLEFLFPLENWSQDDVLAYLRQNSVEIPEFFHFVESSLDCINCTAFLDGIADRREYMAKNHPIEHEKNKANLLRILSAINKPLSYLKEAV